MASSTKCEGNTEPIPSGGSPLVKALDKKAKGYLRALQRSLSSSALERSFSLDEEDPSVMTIDFLRSRLQTQRAHYRAEKHRAEMLARKVCELEQKLKTGHTMRERSKHVEFVTHNRDSEFGRSEHRYDIEENSTSHDESYVEIIAHDLDKQKICKSIACEHCNSHYPIPKSPINGKKKQSLPHFSSYAYHRRSYFDNDVESSYSPRQGQQLGMLNHHLFHDPQTIHVLGHDASIQEEALQGTSVLDGTQELPFRKLEHGDGCEIYPQSPLGMNKLSIIQSDVSPFDYYTSKQFPSCPNINVEYAKNIMPETCYINANDLRPHSTPNNGGTLFQRQKIRRYDNPMSCSRCGSGPHLDTNIDPNTFSHPQQKTTLNRCISYDSFPLNTKEFRRALDDSKEPNRHSNKGLTIPPYHGKHATFIKVLPEDVPPTPTGYSSFPSLQRSKSTSRFYINTTPLMDQQ